ncbi:oxidoreductase [Plectosphaerella cucumerina]|uniref:Oxidoreductase n=1 Tax=Plectosphaerella cucumerina TaxID=40658 RepID=A0A8K0TT77_9PEZI|nr:oxidoreductase [Plectosphaerella cucumerina]
MTVLRVLICGGGIAGPVLGFWLAKLGHDVTILERSPNLRAQGQQIDIRGQAVEVCRRMGVLDTIRSKVVDEDGLCFEDIYCRKKAVLLANKTGQGAQTFTSEFEMMRGELCRIFYEASRTVGVSYRFGAMVTSLGQDEKGVDVTFSDGTSDRYDLVVGADGQSSKTRSMIIPPDENATAFKPLGLWVAYFNIPREPQDDKLCTVCNIPNANMTLRPDNPKTAQAYLAYRPNDEATDTRLRRAYESRDLAQQKQVWTDLFRGVGWQSDRILRELNESSVADQFYFSEIGQVKMKRWSEGRVTLLGDAGYCPSGLTGLGTSTAIVGAYVLAGEISKACSGSGEDDGVRAALRSYDETMRPWVDRAQKLIPGVPGIAVPRTWWGIWLLHSVVWLLATLRVDKIAQYFGSDDLDGFKLPDCPKMQE